jgi:DNA-binding MarR family transcriptional regulator
VADDLASRSIGPDEIPGFLLCRAARNWQYCQREALAALNLTHVQFALLAGLNSVKQDNTRPMTQRDLARHCRVNEMTVSKVIRELEDRGLIIRDAHPNDLRAVAVALTPKGGSLLGTATPLVEKADADFFHAAGEKFGDVVEVLKRIA